MTGPRGDAEATESATVLSMIFAYYENPAMLRYQLEQMVTLGKHILDQVEIVLVDDGSPRNPASLVAMDFPALPLYVFRIEEDRPWNQDAARNIGAWEARAPKLLLTDIDHVVPKATVLRLIELDPQTEIFTLQRRAHFSDKEIDSHVNSFFLSKERYWQVGGYDEDYWGWYGTDKLFRKRLIATGDVTMVRGFFLELVTRGSILDAKNTSLRRRPSVPERIRHYFWRLGKGVGLLPAPRVLTNPYSRQIP